MSLNLGSYSDTITRDFRRGDAKISAISAPTKASTQRGTAITVTFTLQAYEVATASVVVYYSTDGATWSAATVTGDTTNLTASEAGTSHSVTWDSVTDLGTNDEWASVQIGIIADDLGAGGGDVDRIARSDPFTVNNLPTTPTISSPDDGSFGKSLTKNIEFSISSADPGADKLYPYLQADLTSDFDSDLLKTKDSQDGSTHDQFDHKVTAATAKPLPGYYVQGKTVSGSTTITYADETDLFTGSALPASITNARVIPICKADRRVYVSAVSDTECTLEESAAGAAADGLVDLWVFDDPSTNFFVKGGISVTSTSPAATTFAAMGNDDFGTDITDDFGTAPRVMVVDEADRMVILGTVTGTQVSLSKSVSGLASNGSVTLFICKDNTDIYQDADEAVASTTLTAVTYSSLSDGGALPAYIPGAIAFPVPKADRHVYIGEPVGDQVKAAKSAMGAVANGSVDWNIWTKEVGSGIWVPMSPNGIPDDYEGEDARFRPESGDFAEGSWIIRVAFGNVA